ncbi:MAG: hypothetical protein ACTSXO_08295 [Candidatus Heimdallarchaeota archaeon]
MMSYLYKIPLELKDINDYLEEEQNFLRGFVKQLENSKNEGNPAKLEIVDEILTKLPNLIDIIFPMKEPVQQIQALQKIARILAKIFMKTKLKQLGVKNKWILLTNGYLGRFVDENYEVAILLYLVALVYQANAQKHVQTSPQYRYFFISAYSAIKGAILFMKKLKPEPESYAYPFYQMLLLRKIEIEAELTKAEAFIARKQGNFERAAKLFAGAASYRFSMMNFDLPETTDTRVKIFASTELGMACFYIAVGYSNNNQLNESHFYLLKAKHYFENAVKLSESNTELLEAANRRLDLVNPYINRVKKELGEDIKKVEEIPDPQPLMKHPEPEALFKPGEVEQEPEMICSNCFARIPWSEKCPECKEVIIHIEAHK